MKSKELDDSINNLVAVLRHPHMEWGVSYMSVIPRDSFKCTKYTITSKDSLHRIIIDTRSVYPLYNDEEITSIHVSMLKQKVDLVSIPVFLWFKKSKIETEAYYQCLALIHSEQLNEISLGVQRKLLQVVKKLSKLRELEKVKQQVPSLGDGVDEFVESVWNHDGIVESIWNHDGIKGLS